jgi:hypothetical protein
MKYLKSATRKRLRFFVAHALVLSFELVLWGVLITTCPVVRFGQRDAPVALSMEMVGRNELAVSGERKCPRAK